MKKVLLAIMILGAAVISITCERNALYDNTKDDVLSLMALGLNNPPAPPTDIHIYSAGQHDGNLGGRSGADAFCIAAGPPAGTTTVHAFLSVSPTDQIINLVPAIYWSGISVVDGGGAMLISTDWNNLWDGNIDTDLSAAGVIPLNSQWWNGSNTAGTLNSDNCSNWTSASSIVFGVRGNSNFSDANWISSPPTSSCTTNANYVLCMAY